MGPLLELLLAPVVTFLNEFDEPVTLTHRAFWFDVNPFGSGATAMITRSALGKVVNGDFRPFASTREEVGHSRAELKAIVQAGGNFIARVVQAHKDKVGQ